MNLTKLRRAKYYMRLTYPVRVTARATDFLGEYPDLPGCRSSHGDIQQLYRELEAARQEWIMERVLEGKTVPLPNSHLQPAPETVAVSHLESPPLPSRAHEAT